MCTREREGFEIRIVSEDEPKCVCRCKPGRPLFKETTCKCVDPELPCYKDHYDGKCSCECQDCDGGCCDCVLLARLDRPDLAKPDWIADHRVRRFVRPVLMRDPQVEIEQKKRKRRRPNAKSTAARRQPHRLRARRRSRKPRRRRRAEARHWTADPWRRTAQFSVSRLRSSGGHRSPPPPNATRRRSLDRRPEMLQQRLGNQGAQLFAAQVVARSSSDPVVQRRCASCEEEREIASAKKGGVGGCTERDECSVGQHTSLHGRRCSNAGGDTCILRAALRRGFQSRAVAYRRTRR